MATLLYTIFSFTAGASLHCAVRREISPCTCSPHQMFANTIIVTCEKMESFSHVVDVLQDKFTPDFQIWLKITHSQLLDFDERKFAEMNMNIKNLRLNHNSMRWVEIIVTAVGRIESNRIHKRVTDRGGTRVKQVQSRKKNSLTTICNLIFSTEKCQRSIESIYISPQKRSRKILCLSFTINQLFFVLLFEKFWNFSQILFAYFNALRIIWIDQKISYTLSLPQWTSQIEWFKT